MRNFINDMIEIFNEGDIFERVMLIILAVCGIGLTVAATCLVLGLCGIIEMTSSSECVPYVPTPWSIFFQKKTCKSLFFVRIKIFM